MIREIQRQKEGILVELCLLEPSPLKPTSPDTNSTNPNNRTPPNIPRFVDPILKKYQLVFHMPVGLHPIQAHEHAINLRGTNPISVRP